MFSDVVKSRKETVTKIGRLFKEAVVGGFPPGVVPKSFLRVEFGRVFGQRKNFHAMPLLFEPSPDRGVSMIGRVVLDEVEAMTAAVIGWQDDVFQEGLIGGVVEILGLVAVGEFGVQKTDRAQNLLGVALATGGDFRPTVQRRPGLMQGGALAKGRLVHVNDYRAFGFGVFFRLG